MIGFSRRGRCQFQEEEGKTCHGQSGMRLTRMLVGVFRVLLDSIPRSSLDRRNKGRNTSACAWFSSSDSPYPFPVSARFSNASALPRLLSWSRLVFADRRRVEHCVLNLRSYNASPKLKRLH